MKFGVEIPFVNLLGFDLALFEDGQSQIRYAPRPDHRNAFGVTHGGALNQAHLLLHAARRRSHAHVQQRQRAKKGVRALQFDVKGEPVVASA